MIESIAVLDIGTNSIKFCIANNCNGIISVREDSVHATRLGENVPKAGTISSMAMERNIQKIQELCNHARQSGVSRIIAIGTMIFRHAANADAFIQRVESQCNIKIRVLSGEDEARLSYLAAVSSIDGISENIIVMDSGGGSTELTFGKDLNSFQSMSFEVGAVTLTDKFCKHDPISHFEIEQMYNQIQKKMNLHKMNGSGNLIGSCGAISTMSAVKQQISNYDPNVIHASILTRHDVLKQINLFASKTISQRKKIPGIQKGREDIALAGACIVDYVMSRLECEQLIVCERGLRYGIIKDFFSQTL
jgi:exopolyphosphatase/guanosine-5'-triphosphate,3'-diphosphate pyrophosphatase